MAKQKGKKTGWSIFWCPMCKTYQETSGQCQNCGYGETIRKIIKNPNEYCELLGEHVYKITGKKALGRGKWEGFWFYWPYIMVEQCIRCGNKRVKEVTNNYFKDLAITWGEQP